MAQSDVVPQPTVPGYEILGELGRGGMGVVYRARQVSLNRLVALKMILAGPHASSCEVARFRVEAEAVARLQHPNIIQIFEIGEHQGLPFLALELVDGPGLDKIVHGNPFAPARAAQVVETLARAMHHAHQQGIIHRDLKPANVLMGPVLKLTDFGLAKLQDNDAAPCATKTIAGTPNYMAPEQAMGPGSTVGALADVYALGAILYELLTGRPPFHGKTVFEVLQQVREQEPVPPRRMLPQLPRDLETICLKCLRKEPGQRYGSAFDLAEDIRRFLAHEPIQARPASVWHRAAKFAMRRPALAGLHAATTAAVVIPLVLTVWHRSDLQNAVGHAHVDARQEQLRQLEEARAMYQRFTEHRGDALFHWTFRALLPHDHNAADSGAAQKAIHKALAIVNLREDAAAGPTFNPYWSSREKADVAAGCYQLLLILADITGHPSPDQPEDVRKESMQKAVTVLDWAAKLFRPTQAVFQMRSRCLAQLGDERGAAVELQKAANVLPTSFIDSLLLGDQHYQSGDVQAAAQNFQQALLLEPSDFWSQCLLALCQLKLKRPAEAEIGLSKCIVQRPDFIWTRVLRGVARSELNELQVAESDFGAALELRPSVDARYVICVSRGLLRFRNQRFDEASADLQEAIALKPDQFHARLTLAKLLQVQQQLDKSNEQLEIAVKLCPGPAIEAECHVELSRNMCLVKDYAGALRAAEEAVKTMPDCSEAHQRCGYALLHLQRFQEAVMAFDLSQAKGGTPTPDFYRARGQAKMQLRDYLGAREDYTRALEMEPGPEILTHRGWAYFFADAWKPALHDFDEAIRLDPTYCDAYAGRGLSRVMLGDVAGAVSDANDAQRLEPRTAEMTYNVACTFALAASQTEKNATNSDLHSHAAEYRELALRAVRRTLEMIPANDRGAFWRNTILVDPALDSIRNCQGFKELDKY